MMNTILWNEDRGAAAASGSSAEVQETVRRIYAALCEKGYDPVRQITGYMLSGDPTYITSYNGARTLAARLDPGELLEQVVRSYLEQ